MVRLAVRQWKKDKVVLLGRGDKEKNEPAFQRSVKCGPVFCRFAHTAKDLPFSVEAGLGACFRNPDLASHIKRYLHNNCTKCKTRERQAKLEYVCHAS